jgi:hypothetical protein
MFPIFVAPKILGKALDLGDVVETFLEMFRRERGAAQHNLGVCITKFCSNGRYRERVKEGNGLESLHQIQLPKVNDQKDRLRDLSGFCGTEQH